MSLIQLLEGFDGQKKPCKDCSPVEGIGDEGVRFFWGSVGLAAGIAVGFLYARSRAKAGKSLGSTKNLGGTKKSKQLGAGPPNVSNPGDKVMKTTYTYGQLPPWKDFERAFENEGGGPYPMTLRGEDARAAEETAIDGGGEFTAEELYEGLQDLVEKHDHAEDLPGGQERLDEGNAAGSLASGILSTLGFEWI